MRESLASFADIHREMAGEAEWLAQWNRHWGCYNFVGGHKRPNESFRECLFREVNEELGLEHGVDFQAAMTPTVQLAYEAWSAGAKEQTAYKVELFHVELLSTTCLQKIAANIANRWLTRSEISTRVAADGQPISDTMERLLSAAGQPRPRAL